MSFYGAVATDHVALQFDNKDDILAAITQLNTCEKHGGCHHFSVVGEGQILLCGYFGEQCLKSIRLYGKATKLGHE